MSSIPPPIIQCLDQDRPDTKLGFRKGGKPPSPIRFWFIALYLNNRLPWIEKNYIDNVIKYSCPFKACELGPIRGKKIDTLCNHVLNCKHFPEDKKGICLSFHTLSLYS